MKRKYVQMLRDMLAGIPAKNLNLDRVYRIHPKFSYPVELADCGTIGCIWGWARLYPPFLEAGLQNNMGWTSGEQWFGVPPGTFSHKMPHESRSHKQTALARLDKLLGTQP